MQTPSEKTPTITFFRLADYHDEALGAVAEHAPCKARIATASAQLDAAAAAYDTSVRALGRPRARVRLVDLAADRVVDQLYLATVSADGGRPGTGTRGLFPEGKTAIVEPVGPSEVVALRELLDRLNARGTALATEWGPRLSEAATKYREALAARDAARDLSAARREQLREGKRVWIRAYRQNQGALVELYASDKRTLESLFDTFRSTARSDEDDGGGDPGAEDPAPTPAAG